MTESVGSSKSVNYTNIAHTHKKKLKIKYLYLGKHEIKYHCNLSTYNSTYQWRFYCHITGTCQEVAISFFYNNSSYVNNQITEEIPDLAPSSSYLVDSQSILPLGATPSWEVNEGW